MIGYLDIEQKLDVNYLAQIPEDPRRVCVSPRTHTSTHGPNLGHPKSTSAFVSSVVSSVVNPAFPYSYPHAIRKTIVPTAKGKSWVAPASKIRMVWLCKQLC